MSLSVPALAFLCFLPQVLGSRVSAQQLLGRHEATSGKEKPRASDTGPDTVLVRPTLAALSLPATSSLLNPVFVRLLVLESELSADRSRFEDAVF